MSMNVQSLTRANKAPRGILDQENGTGEDEVAPPSLLQCQSKLGPAAVGMQFLAVKL